MSDLGVIGELTPRHQSINRRAVSVVRVLPMSVSGVVYDDTNAATSRLVRAYCRRDGSLLGETWSDPSDGTYTLPCLDEEVQRVVLDDDGGTLHNDLIDRILPG